MVSSGFISPLRYPGGKSSLYPLISELITENFTVPVCFVEGFAGGAGLGLKLLINNNVQKLIINDKDIAVYSFWREILEFPDEFCEWLESLQISIDEWKKYKYQYDLSKRIFDRRKLAHALFYLNRTNISGIIKGGVIGGVEQKGKYLLDARFNVKHLIDRIQRIKKYALNIETSNKDGIEFIKCFNSIEFFLYIDPPYVLKGKSLYSCFFSKEEHELLKHSLDSSKTRWVTSYDQNELIEKLYSKYRIFFLDFLRNGFHHKKKEILIFSNNLSIKNVTKYLGVYHEDF